MARHHTDVKCHSLKFLSHSLNFVACTGPSNCLFSITGGMQRKTMSDSAISQTLSVPERTLLHSSPASDSNMINSMEKGCLEDIALPGPWALTIHYIDTREF